MWLVTGLVNESSFGNVALFLPFFALFALSAKTYKNGLLFKISNTLSYDDVAYSPTVLAMAFRLGQTLAMFKKLMASQILQQKEATNKGITDWRMSYDAFGIIVRALLIQVLQKGFVL